MLHNAFSWKFDIAQPPLHYVTLEWPQITYVFICVTKLCSETRLSIVSKVQTQAYCVTTLGEPGSPRRDVL